MNSKNFLRITASILLGFSLIFQSCQKAQNQETATEEAVYDIVDKAAFNVESDANSGKFGCFEFVYPIGFYLPDGTLQNADSRDDFMDKLKTWVQANMKAGKKKDHKDFEKPHPKLVFPLTVLTEASETKVIENYDELKALKESCGDDYFKKGNHKGHCKKGGPCFKINFPVSVRLPDSTTKTAADREELKAIAKAWRKNNPGVKGHPHLVFPISVTKKDNSVVTVNSKEDLKALKKSCE